MTPKVAPEEVERIITEAGERADRQQMHLSAQDVGEELRLTLQERDALEIRTIRPAGMTERQFQEFRRSRRAANSRAARAADGARPREKSKARTKPWAALTPPISRAAYYRRGLHNPEMLAAYLAASKASETISRPVELALRHETNPSQLPPSQTLVGPARKTSARQNVGADGPSAGARMVRVEAGRAVALAFPGGDDGQQGELLNRPSVHAERALCLMARTAWESGQLPPEIRLAVRDALRAHGLTHEEAGREIGLTRMSVTNAVRARGIDGLSLGAAENLKRLLQRQAGAG